MKTTYKDWDIFKIEAVGKRIKQLIPLVDREKLSHADQWTKISYDIHIAEAQHLLYVLRARYKELLK